MTRDCLVTTIRSCAFACIRSGYKGTGVTYVPDSSASTAVALNVPVTVTVGHGRTDHFSITVPHIRESGSPGRGQNHCQY